MQKYSIHENIIDFFFLWSCKQIVYSEITIENSEYPLIGLNNAFKLF